MISNKALLFLSLVTFCQGRTYIPKDPNEIDNVLASIINSMDPKELITAALGGHHNLQVPRTFPVDSEAADGDDTAEIPAKFEDDEEDKIVVKYEKKADITSEEKEKTADLVKNLQSALSKVIDSVSTTTEAEKSAKIKSKAAKLKSKTDKIKSEAAPVVEAAQEQIETESAPAITPQAQALEQLVRMSPRQMENSANCGIISIPARVMVQICGCEDFNCPICPCAPPPRDL